MQGIYLHSGSVDVRRRHSITIWLHFAYRRTLLYPMLPAIYILLSDSSNSITKIKKTEFDEGRRYYQLMEPKNDKKYVHVRCSDCKYNRKSPCVSSWTFKKYAQWLQLTMFKTFTSTYRRWLSFWINYEYKHVVLKNENSKFGLKSHDHLHLHPNLYDIFRVKTITKAGNNIFQGRLSLYIFFFDALGERGRLLADQIHRCLVRPRLPASPSCGAPFCSELLK